MATYSSGSIYFSGLGSDNDWDTMITQLKEIESSYANKLVAWRDDWQLRLDAFATLRTSMSTLSAKLKTMNTESSFLVKTGTSSDSNVASVSATGDAIDGIYNLEVNQLAMNSYASIDTGVTDKLASLTSTATTLSFTYASPDSSTPTSVTINVPAGTSLEGLKTLINQATGNSGVKATLLQANGEYTLQMYSTSQGAGTDIAITSDGVFSSGTWEYTSGQNAQVKINGWPSGSGNYYEVAGNTLSMYEGITINLLSTGSSTLTVAMDTEKITENVQELVTAINEVLTTIQSLTKVDSSKSTTEIDYATSQFDTQQGSILTGNYGVQMMASKLKTALFSQALGFNYYNSDTGSGDLFSSLAQIGIKTDTDTASSTYGLLIMETDSNFKTLTDALTENSAAVAELFSASKKGVSSYSYVTVADTTLSATQPGTYDVSYTVTDDGSGNPVVTGTIDGKAAVWYPETNQLGLVRADGNADSDADGILLNIFDLTMDGTTRDFTVSVKQGKLTELANLIDNDFLEADSDNWASGTQIDDHKGTLSILESQYSHIISNINDKIAKEEERLVVWERRIRLKFSRLEATLSNYNNINSMLEYQLDNLSSNSS